MPLLGVWYIRILLFACVICPIILVIVLTIWGMVESGAEYVKPFLQMLQISDDMVAQYRELRVTVWTLFFNIFFNTQIPLALFVLVMVGPSLISQDLRFNAIPLYLSRPITRFEYFLGKFGVIAIFMTLALLVPVVAAYVFGVLFSLSFDVVRTTWPLLVGSIIYSLIVTLSASTLMLAMSALSKNSLRVATMWILFLVISHSTASVIEGIYRDPSAGAISYRENLHRVQQACLGVIDASNSFVKFQENMAMQTQRASLGPLANIFGMRQPPRTTNKGGANPGKTAEKQKAPDVKQGSKSSDGGKSSPSQGSKSSPTTNKTGNGPRFRRFRPMVDSARAVVHNAA